MAEKLFNGRRAFWYKWISYRADFIGTDPSIYRFIANSLATLHICNYCIYKKTEYKIVNIWNWQEHWRMFRNFSSDFFPAKNVLYAMQVCTTTEAEGHRELAHHSTLASLAGGKCDLCCDGPSVPPALSVRGYSAANFWKFQLLMLLIYYWTYSTDRHHRNHT